MVGGGEDFLRSYGCRIMVRTIENLLGGIQSSGWWPAARVRANERVPSGSFFKNKHTPEKSRRWQSWCGCAAAEALGRWT